MTETNTAPKPARPSAPAHNILASMLMPDEKIIHQVSISSGIYWKGLTLFVVAILVMIKAFALGCFLLVVSGVVLLVAHLTKYFLLLAATDKRIFIRSGIINLDVIQMRYSKIESVELAWTIMGQLLGYSSVVITGTGQRVTIIPYVADAIKFREKMTKILLDKDEALEHTASAD